MLSLGIHRERVPAHLLYKITIKWALFIIILKCSSRFGCPCYVVAADVCVINNDYFGRTDSLRDSTGGAAPAPGRSNDLVKCL